MSIAGYSVPLLICRAPYGPLSPLELQENRRPPPHAGGRLRRSRPLIRITISSTLLELCMKNTLVVMAAWD
jgi:hypothetical protein